MQGEAMGVDLRQIFFGKHDYCVWIGSLQLPDMERDGKLAKGTQKMADGDGFGGKLLMNLTKEVPL